MRKRTLCLFLSAYLFLSLAGCGGNPAADSGASGTPGASDSSGTSDTPGISDPSTAPTPSDISDPSTTSGISDPSGTSDASGTPDPSDPSSASGNAYEEPIPEDIPPAVPSDPAAAFVDGLTTEQQLEQMFFVRCPDVDALTLVQEHAIGGYILFSRDFEGQTPDTLRATIQSYQEAAAVPLLIGVDEEGGTVVRMSANPAFRASRFRSPQALYREGGFDTIRQDTQEKDALLQGIGLNVNLAPVCDLSTNPNDFIYSRAFGQEAGPTSTYVQTVVGQMQQDHIGSVLKHFPGYGNNADTHTGIAIDERPLETFQANDFQPFQAGITAGAGAVMVSHNVVKAMDPTVPASLSPTVHQLLREQLGFAGVIMTDDLMMEAITKYTDGEDAAVLAVLAGNDMLISSDFAGQYQAILTALEAGTIPPEQIRNSAMRVIRWKMQLGLLPETVPDEMATPSGGMTQTSGGVYPSRTTWPNRVTRHNGVAQGSPVPPSGGATNSGDTTPSGSATDSGDSTPSGTTTQSGSTTPSGDAIDSGDSTPSKSATPSGDVSSSKPKQTPTHKSTTSGGTTHHTRSHTRSRRR